VVIFTRRRPLLHRGAARLHSRDAYRICAALPAQPELGKELLCKRPCYIELITFGCTLFFKPVKRYQGMMFISMAPFSADFLAISFTCSKLISGISTVFTFTLSPASLAFSLRGTGSLQELCPFNSFIGFVMIPYKGVNFAPTSGQPHLS